jgi:hypothetical protein
MSISSSSSDLIEDIEDVDQIKQKVIKKIENGDDPNSILIQVYANQNLSKGDKLKIARYLVLKGADRSLMINNASSLARGSTLKKSTFRKSRAKSRKFKKSTFRKSRAKSSFRKR